MTEQAVPHDSQVPDRSPMYFRSALWPHFRGLNARATGFYPSDDQGGGSVRIYGIDEPGRKGIAGVALHGDIRAQYEYMEEREVDGHKGVYTISRPYESGTVSARLLQDAGEETVVVDRPEGMTERQAFDHLGIRTG